MLVAILPFLYHHVDFALRVSSRDIAVLLAAFRSLQSDTPSVSPGNPSPPIVPLTKAEPAERITPLSEEGKRA